jgi:hypothetical protein
MKTRKREMDEPVSLLDDTYKKICNLEGIEGIVESTTPRAGPPDLANPTVSVRMTNGYYDGRVIIGLDVLNVTPSSPRPTTEARTCTKTMR